MFRPCAVCGPSNKKQHFLKYGIQDFPNCHWQVCTRQILNTYCLMNCTASSYFIPHSMSARATNTGALVEGKEHTLQNVSQ